jgi:polyisoprenoid-binding protein YceI
MTRKQINQIIALFVIGLVSITCNSAMAQSLKINPKSSTMTILGTTNVHDFKTKVEQMKGELVINAKQVQSLNVEIPVKSIKSGESLMDKKTYEAFDDAKNPTISFQMTDVTSMLVNGSEVSATVTGNLTMAGAARKITFKTTGKNLKPGVYEFSGSIPLKMTDFKMKPPTAMLGMMKVADAITLKYNVVLEGAPIN